MKDAARTVLITPKVLRSLGLPRPDEGGDKEERGRVLVVGGSREMPGAVVLAATAALRAGAGKLRIATAKSAAMPVAALVVEARVYSLPETSAGDIAAKAAGVIGECAGGARAVCVGPGMADERRAAALVKKLLPLISGATVILDANALSGLTGARELVRRLGGRALLTPNSDELEAMCEGGGVELSGEPSDVALRVAGEFDAVAIVKGRETFIAAPGGCVYVNRAGNVGLATSGSGDVLSGVIAGLAARGADPLAAAVWGVHAHALAGDRLAERVGSLGYLARELLDELPRVLDALEKEAGQAKVRTSRRY